MWVCACQLLISVKHVCVCAHCKKKVDYVFKTATKTVLETWFRMEYIFVIKVTILFVAKGQPNPNKNLIKQCKVENWINFLQIKNISYSTEPYMYI